MRLRDCILAMGMVGLAACGHIRDRGMSGMGKPIPVDNGERDRAASRPDPKRAAEANVGLAEEYMESKDYEAALEKLQKAIKLDGSSAAAYSMLGLLYERIHRPVQAGDAYSKSSKLAPDKGDIQNNYGVWLCHSGHPAESDVYFRKALDDPFYKTPEAALGNAGACALGAGKPALAETYYRRLLEQSPNDADGLQQLATVLYQRGDYIHARAFMERRVGAGAANPQMLDLASRIEEKLGDRGAAATYRQRLANEFPQYTPGQL